MRLLRGSEWVLLGFFSYTAVLAQVLRGRSAAPLVTLGVNVAVIGGLFLLAWAYSLRTGKLPAVLRDWYPMPLLLLAYREMGWLAPSHHSYRLERIWVQWDKTLLNDWGLKGAIESLGVLIPSVLEISYVLVYATAPAALGFLYACRRRQRAEPLLRIIVLAVLSAYALFPWFPSEPPRTVFPGQDFPSVSTIFRRLNWAMLGSYGIHTSVFPSAHVSGAFSAAFAMVRLLPERRWVGWLFTGLAVSIATATVYGRYHYLADALAGFGLAVLACAIATALEKRQGVQPRAAVLRS